MAACCDGAHPHGHSNGYGGNGRGRNESPSVKLFRRCQGRNPVIDTMQSQAFWASDRQITAPPLLFFGPDTPIIRTVRVGLPEGPPNMALTYRSLHFRSLRFLPSGCLVPIGRHNFQHRGWILTAGAVGTRIV